MSKYLYILLQLTKCNLVYKSLQIGIYSCFRKIDHCLFLLFFGKEQQACGSECVGTMCAAKCTGALAQKAVEDLGH